MIGPAPDCLNCAHFRDDVFDCLACEAFPKGIPENIIFGEKHDKPIEGQTGNYVFKAKD